MNPELERAKSALKSLADAKKAGKPIDLSSLPEPLRQKLQAQLQRLPPEMQKELLARGSPIVNKAIERVEQGVESGLPARKVWQNTSVLPGNYSGHYNNTIQPGDRMQFTIGRFLLFFGVAAAIYYLVLAWQTPG
jgi:hypothetical protein